MCDKIHVSQKCDRCKKNDPYLLGLALSGSKWVTEIFAQQYLIYGLTNTGAEHRVLLGGACKAH